MRNSPSGRAQRSKTWDACTLTEPSRLQVCLMPGKTRVFGWTGWSVRYIAPSLIYGEDLFGVVSGIDSVTSV